MWSKFDDQIYMNPKIAAICRDDQDVYIAGIIYCNGQLTDGFIPSGVLMMLCTWAKIPFEANAQANAQAIASRLVEANLWELSEKGYQVHDFLEWNISREDAIKLKSERSEAGKRGGQASAAKRQANAQAIASPSAQAKSKQNPTQSPSQTHNIPNQVMKDKSISVRKAKPRDPLLDNPAVMLCRDILHITPNEVQRKLLSETVVNSELFEDVLTRWMKHGWNPRNIDGMINAYQNGGIKENGNGRQPVKEYNYYSVDGKPCDEFGNLKPE